MLSLNWFSVNRMRRLNSRSANVFSSCNSSTTHALDYRAGPDFVDVLRGYLPDCRPIPVCEKPIDTCVVLGTDRGRATHVPSLSVNQCIDDHGNRVQLKPVA